MKYKVEEDNKLSAGSKGHDKMGLRDEGKKGENRKKQENRRNRCIL